MSDRTYFQMTVYDGLPVEMTEITRILRDTIDDDIIVILGDEITAAEVVCGTVNELAATLAEAAPSSTWIMWEDPRYEWLGDVAVHVPGLGLYRHDCGSDGDPLFTGGAINQMLNDAMLGDSPIRQQVALAAGEPWFEKIRSYETAEVKP